MSEFNDIWKHLFDITHDREHLTRDSLSLIYTDFINWNEVTLDSFLKLTTTTRVQSDQLTNLDHHGLTTPQYISSIFSIDADTDSNHSHHSILSNDILLWMRCCVPIITTILTFVYVSENSWKKRYNHYTHCMMIPELCGTTSVRKPHLHMMGSCLYMKFAITILPSTQGAYLAIRRNLIIFIRLLMQFWTMSFIQTLISHHYRSQIPFGSSLVRRVLRLMIGSGLSSRHSFPNYISHLNTSFVFFFVRERFQLNGELIWRSLFVRRISMVINARIFIRLPFQLNSSSFMRDDYTVSDRPLSQHRKCKWTLERTIHVPADYFDWNVLSIYIFILVKQCMSYSLILLPFSKASDTTTSWRKYCVEIFHHNWFIWCSDFTTMWNLYFGWKDNSIRNLAIILVCVKTLDGVRTSLHFSLRI